MGNKRIVIGNRIPYKFFVTTGIGESAITQHAGSYHFALHNAGIEMCNIMTYSSILPCEATQIDKPETLVHGSVMESIMAVCQGGMDDICSAGIIFAWLYDYKKITHAPKKIGGIVCEYAANVDETSVRNKLHNALTELYTSNYSQYQMSEPTVITSSFICKNKYGTSLVALCFTEYIIPIL